MPFDINISMQARLQTDGFHGEKTYKGTFHCFAEIIKKEGVRSSFTHILLSTAHTH